MKWTVLGSCALLAAAAAPAQHTISAPDRVKAGDSFEVSVSGELPSNTIIAIVEKGHPPGRGPLYGYFHKPPKASLRAPDKPGPDYELRLLENHRKLLATRPIAVEGVNATLEAPPSVQAGESFQIAWTGPQGQGDTIRLAEIGSDAKVHVARTYPGRNPVGLTAPDKAGEYELRYVTGQSGVILVSRRIQVGGTSASLDVPAEVEAGAELVVGWEGPGNSSDTISVAPAAGGKRLVWSYPSIGNPAIMSAPLTPGDYEILYRTGQSRAILARAPLRVTAAATQPGKLRVEGGAAGASLAGAAVEIILDASGSMLQRMGSERRIEVAKRTLTALTSDVIPSGTPFALRVFGKEAGSCQTDLEIPLTPLNPAAVAAKIASLQAKNNAKTPIAASLQKVQADLGSARGERIVVLVTDGEETCDGDPAAAITALRAAGSDVRVNIVGFAIDDEGLREAFEEWAGLGGGAYFDANDADALTAALQGAVRRSFEVLDASGRKVASGVAGGEPVDLMPGAYVVKAGSQSLPAEIEAGRLATVTLE